MKSVYLFFITVCFCYLASLPVSSQNSTFERLMEYANGVKIINTHEHQIMPKKLNNMNYNFWMVLNRSYLIADLVSAGGSRFNENNTGLDELWQQNGNYLEFTENTSYYLHFLEGMKKCYGYNENTFTREGVEKLSEQIADKYTNYSDWFDDCFNKSNFQTMFLDQYWSPHNLDIDKKYFTLIFHTNKLVNDISNPGRNYRKTEKYFPLFAEESGITDINSLNDYLLYTDYLLRKAKEKGAVGIKNSMAYQRSVYYENISRERTMELFDKPGVSQVEKKELQDFMFHWILEKAGEYNLTVQIHIGYLAGNGNQLDNGHPAKLNNLFLQHPDTKFDLFHGGFPWTGEFTAFGKMFTNVYLNLVWLPQISRKRALITLHEILDCVPYNKILWGGDCHYIEESVGSLEFGKQVICEVLAERISNGQMNEVTAKKIIAAIFRDNAIELFNLKY